MKFILRSPLILLALLALALCTPVSGSPQEPPKPSKPSLAIRKLDSTPSVREAAKRSGQEAVLQQVLEGADSQLTSTIEQTRKFTIVARKDLGEVLKEQDLRDSGVVQKEGGDGGGLKDAGFVLTMTIDNFQDVTNKDRIEGQLGPADGERREITVQAVIKIFDSRKGTLLRTSNQSFTKRQFAEVLAGQTQEGRATNKVIGEVSRELARRGANEIADFVFPARIMAMTNGILTFNRTKESGVQPGQWWEVFAPGQEMFDPDTGESLGSEEVHIGWAKITDAGDKFSKAQCYGDNGVDCGAILRLKDAAPEGSDKLEKSSGACQGAPGGGGQGVRFIANEAGEGSTGGAAAPAPAPAKPTSAAAEKPIQLAIFVKNRAKAVPDGNVMVMEDALVARVTTSSVEIIAREDALNALSRFSSEGANKGTGDPKALDVDKVLSEQTSAVNLARNLGADALLIASITSLTESPRRIRDADLGIDRTQHEQLLTVTYRILDGGTGGSLAAGDVVIKSAWSSGGNLETGAPPIEDEIRKAGEQLAVKVLAALTGGKMRQPSQAAAEVEMEIRTSIVDLAVPEIVMEGGKPTISSGSYKLEPMSVNVYVDGLLVGTAPGQFKVPAGLHRIKCERPMFKPYEGMVSFKAGQRLNIPMQLTDEGLARVRDNARFFQDLKERVILTEAQAKLAEGYAEMLRNSSIRIDTGNLSSISVENNYWAKLFRK